MIPARRTRQAALAGGVLLLLAAVAIVAGMSRPTTAPTAAHPPIETSALLGWGLAAAVVVGLGVAFLGPMWTGREKAVAAAVFVVLVLALLGLAERNRAATTVPPPPAVQPAPSGRALPTPPPRTSSLPALPVPRQTPATTGSGGVPTGVVAIIGAAAVLVALSLLSFGRRRDTASPRIPADGALSTAVAASVEEVEAEQDPRRAVVAAWIGMGDALARSGVPREPSEAPLEYMGRALGAVEVSRESVQRLTRLFAWARFSGRPTTAAMRDDALAALRGVRDELRARGR